MALLLEGCCSRSASAAVSMAHVTLARVSAVWGRRASGTAVGGLSSDCAGGCCIAALIGEDGKIAAYYDPAGKGEFPAKVLGDIP